MRKVAGGLFYFPPEIGGEAVPEHPVDHSEDVPDPRGGVPPLLGALHHPRDLVWRTKKLN